jgi:hypothetical protein
MPSTPAPIVIDRENVGGGIPAVVIAGEIAVRNSVMSVFVEVGNGQTEAIVAAG